MLKYLGHERVYVMDEGYSAWKNAKFPVSDHQAVRIPSQYEANIQHDMLVSMEDVLNVVNNGDGGAMLIDSREARRYQGLEEPIDPIASYNNTFSVNANLTKSGCKLRNVGEWMATAVCAYWGGELFFEM